MKKVFSIVLILFFCIQAFCYDGFFNGEKNLQVIKTEWFDIIYSEKTESSAKKIALVADSFYDEITTKLGTQKYQRFPVSITGAIDQSNAFFSPAPYNLICVYDTTFDNSLDSVDGIEQIFYHELTHAVTLNIKSPFWRGLSVFADFFTLAGISLTSFWYEGATVSFESLGDGGRLNSPFFTQAIVQCKIDGKFPSWRDVTSARDSFPSGTDAYLFGGAFAKYLQETFGMEKYGEFWKRAGKSTSLSFCAGVFKKVYKIKMSDAWKNFYDSIPLPQISSNNYKLISNKNAVISSFDIFEGKIAYFDKLSCAVFLYDENTQKTKRLFSASGINKLSFSQNGKYLAISQYVSRSNTKAEIGIYDIEEKKFINLKKESVKEATIFDNENELLIASFDIKNKNINVSSINKDKLSEKNLIQKYSINLSESQTPYSIQFIDSKRIAFIIKENLSWKVVIFDEDKKIAEYDFGKTIVHNLHFERSFNNEKSFSFTFAKLGETLGTFSKAGKLYFDEENFSMRATFQSSNNDFGFIEYSKNYVVAEKFYSNPLYKIENDLEFSESFVLNKKIENINIIEKNISIKNDFETEKYNPFKYFKNGAILPFSFASEYSSSFNVNSYAFLGLTFASSTPWTDKITILSAGFNPSTKNVSSLLTVSGGNDSLSYSLNANITFDSNGFVQTFDSLSFSKVLYHFLINTISFGASSSLFYGEEESELYDDVFFDVFHNKSQANISFSNIHKFSPRYNDYFGFSFKPFIFYEYEIVKLDDKKKDKYCVNTGLSFLLKIPCLFPISLSSTLFPDMEHFATASASVQLFALEIQKGIPAISVYANRFVLSTSYLGKIEYDSEDNFDIKRTIDIAQNITKKDYSDSLSLSGTFTLHPNTSYFAGEFSFSLRGSLIYRPNPKSEESKFGYGIYLNANF